MVGSCRLSFRRRDIQEQPGSHPDMRDVRRNTGVSLHKSSGSIRPFAEAGAGVRLLSRVDETPDRGFFSSFQFSDMAGVGAQFGVHRTCQAGFRFQHLSNAGLRHSNPGISFRYIQYASDLATGALPDHQTPVGNPAVETSWFELVHAPPGALMNAMNYEPGFRCAHSRARIITELDEVRPRSATTPFGV
ncbi:acyloxyacyl hydrolase [Paraburkholderia silvatlantica]|uniref:acyloxyacyl hydrolase n=2 Tax=Paraburkholderia silvatlantica TaxID=321895 RepID=UPI003611972E